MPRSTLSPMSEPPYTPRLRPERLLAAGRVVLAVSSLFAVWLDPSEPVRFAAVAYGVLMGYVGYALAVAAMVWRMESVSPLWPVVTHATDLVCFSLFIFFTEGPASPFTVYFVFALLSATLRWQARGTFWTALVVIAAFFGFGIYFGIVLDDPEFDLRALIIRGVYLMVLAALLGYVGAQDQRTLREMWRLAAWPQTLRHDAESVVQDLLAYAAPLLQAPTLILSWAELEAPSRREGVWNRGLWTHERQPADAPLVDDAIRSRAFIYTAAPRRTRVQEPGSPYLVLWPGNPLNPEFARRFAPRTALSVSIRGESFEGRLFVLDKEDVTLDDLVLGEVVAGLIAAKLDAFYLTEQLRQSAATEERIRLARDLHDGALQSFTGIGLKLAAIRRMMNTGQAGAAEALADVQRVLASEQRDLRFFIQELKPMPPVAESAALEVRIRELAQRMEREWDLRVELSLEAPGRELPAALCRDVYHIVREGLVNAARHGEASLARVAIAPAGTDAIALSIADNGRGFPFAGRYSAEELATMNLGPKTLSERVGAIKGSLVVDSSPSGAALNVVLPFGAAA